MKINKITPKVTLVGAGPGDIELITLKGINALKSANVILYDALVNEELLDLAPNAIKIFVGKRKGFKAYSQEEINQLLVDKAFLYGHAVRLFLEEVMKKSNMLRLLAYLFLLFLEYQAPFLFRL